MFNFIISILPSIASAAVIAASGFVIKWARNKSKEHNDLLDHLKEADEVKKSVEDLSKAIEELRNTNESQSLALREIMGEA